MVKVLIVEDDTTFATILENFLNRKGYSVVVKSSVKSGVEAYKGDNFQLILLDYRLGDGTGLDVLTQIDAGSKHLPVVMMTNFNDVRTAVQAMRLGVYDYITKPVNPDELLMIVQQALDNDEQPQSDNGRVTRQARLATARNADNAFVEGESKASRKLHEYIALVAPTDMSVLIRGESGTGKEYVARTVHKLSKRADKPFVSIDCGTLSKELASSELFGHVKGSFTGALQDKVGQFVEANGGTLFLDEIGNLSYDVQVKLLRALQEKVVQPVGGNKLIEVDVRIIAATNEDLVGSFADGKFREDLYHRINEFEILVPALRDRTEDFQSFVSFFIDQANVALERHVKHIDPEAMGILRAYDWPGNLRELRNVLKRMVLLSSSDTVGIDALPEEMVEAFHHVPQTDEDLTHSILPTDELNLAIAQGDPLDTDLKSHSEAYERVLIMEVLKKVKYNKSKAAKILNIDRKTLYNKMEKYDIE